MNKAEIVKLFALISALYPREAAFAKATREMVNAWAMMLEDVPFDTAQTGLQAHVATSPFPPSVAEIKGWAVKLSERYIDASEAWGIARKTISKWGVHARQKARENTPPEVWTIMDRMGYEDMCMSEAPDVIRGQFTRLWDARIKRQQEADRLPPAVKDAVLRQKSGMELETATNGDCLKEAGHDCG